MNRLTLMLSSSLLLACAAAPGDSEPPCLGPSSVPSSAPITRLGVHLQFGDAGLAPGELVALPDGGAFEPTVARLYVSQVELLDEAGAAVKVDLVDERRERLAYGLTLLDFEEPARLGLELRAPAGRYRGLRLTLGVPQTCETGAPLNHADASTRRPPLDVDSDMFWSWDPGYVFLKFEGQLAGPGDSQAGFFFHLGGDERLLRLELPLDFTIEPTGGSGPELVVDFARLADLSNPERRRVHGGVWADALADNVRQSNVLRLTASH